MGIKSFFVQLNILSFNTLHIITVGKIGEKEVVAHLSVKSTWDYRLTLKNQTGNISLVIVPLFGRNIYIVVYI